VSLCYTRPMFYRLQPVFHLNLLREWSLSDAHCAGFLPCRLCYCSRPKCNKATTKLHYAAVRPGVGRQCPSMSCLKVQHLLSLPRVAMTVLLRSQCVPGSRVPPKASLPPCAQVGLIRISVAVVLLLPRCPSSSDIVFISP
jgi:hypothetical protein